MQRHLAALEAALNLYPRDCAPCVRVRPACLPRPWPADALLFFFERSEGFRSLNPSIYSGRSTSKTALRLLLHCDQVPDLMDHSTRLWGVGQLHRVLIREAEFR